jgi:hypothetical protein
MLGHEPKRFQAWDRLAAIASSGKSADPELAALVNDTIATGQCADVLGVLTALHGGFQFAEQADMRLAAAYILALPAGILLQPDMVICLEMVIDIGVQYFPGDGPAVDSDLTEAFGAALMGCATPANVRSYRGFPKLIGSVIRSCGPMAVTTEDDGSWWFDTGLITESKPAARFSSTLREGFRNLPVAVQRQLTETLVGAGDLWCERRFAQRAIQTMKFAGSFLAERRIPAGLPFWIHAALLHEISKVATVTGCLRDDEFQGLRVHLAEVLPPERVLALDIYYAADVQGVECGLAYVADQAEFAIDALTDFELWANPLKLLTNTFTVQLRVVEAYLRVTTVSAEQERDGDKIVTLVTLLRETLEASGVDLADILHAVGGERASALFLALTDQIETFDIAVAAEWRELL